MWTSHVEARISAAHSNGPEGQKCFRQHGHDWLVEVQFTYEHIDEWGWGPSFGDVKDIIRHYDHDNLNERMIDKPSSENLARMLYHEILDTINAVPDWVRVHEGDGNYVSYSE